MDLRAYYRKLRDIEGGITEPFVVVVSLETPDGGHAGVMTETERGAAARLVADGRARLATATECEGYHADSANARRAAEQAAQASKVQFAVISDTEMKALKGAVRPTKA